MPLLFLGHGSPMNAIEENEFVTGFRNISTEIPKPNAILCISAHWETQETQVTAMKNPATIHDFFGFPQELFEVQYPAPGSPKLAMETKLLIKSTEVNLDYNWGLDHGAWSVIKHLYPDADIPTVEMSLDVNKTPQQHYELAQELIPLREKGVLIIGSGNIVHNLKKVDWQKINEEFAYDWAMEANEKVKQLILDDDHQMLIDFKNQGSAFQLAIPSVEHYLPLLYILGLKEKGESISFFNDKPVAGALSMTSLKIE
ncbi:4,5-DOPA-extradiol-dioxygenase [Candidatus Nitrosacidococcus tergens]|nr:4,5-DOPA dioxygenase extradiol [Candidatus Nitrosacidococcus tergens]